MERKYLIYLNRYFNFKYMGTTKIIMGGETMTIIKKQDTMLHEQVKDLKKKIEDNNLCLSKEIEPLVIKREAYTLEYDSNKKKVKYKNKGFVNIAAIICVVVGVGIAQYSYKSIMFDMICGFCAFIVVKAVLYEKLTSFVKPNEGLKKVQIEICEIENRYKNENYVIKDKLDKIEKGLNGEVNVSSLIEKELTDKFILLNDIVIPTASATTQIDHILITPTRVICIETKSSEGIYYPNKDGWMWYPTKRQKYGRSATGVLQPNPAKQANYHSNSLSNYLKANSIDYKVESIVVLSNQYSEFKGDNRYCDIIHFNKLIEYLRLDTTCDYIINSKEANNISELLLAGNEKTSGEHYGRYSNEYVT